MIDLFLAHLIKRGPLKRSCDYYADLDAPATTHKLVFPPMFTHRMLRPSLRILHATWGVEAKLPVTRAVQALFDYRTNAKALVPDKASGNKPMSAHRLRQMVSRYCRLIEQTAKVAKGSRLIDILPCRRHPWYHVYRKGEREPGFSLRIRPTVVAWTASPTWTRFQ